LDSIEFVVGEVDLGNGVQECAEPVINGESLVDTLARVEGRLGYAGLAPEDLSRVLNRVESEGKAQILRCTCGDNLCSSAHVTVEIQPDEVVWHSLWGSHRASADAHAALGPWRFSRAAYETALAEPRRVAGRHRTPPQ
jgi:hypothetical protein